MRVVEFSGVAVKRQRKINDNQILITFYNKPPKVVSVKDWEQFSGNKYYGNNVRRCDVVRT